MIKTLIIVYLIGAVLSLIVTAIVDKKTSAPTSERYCYPIDLAIMSGIVYAGFIVLWPLLVLAEIVVLVKKRKNIKEKLLNYGKSIIPSLRSHS
jgi:hypothetical protein